MEYQITTGKIDAARSKRLRIFGIPILADDGDKTRLGKETRCKRRVDARAAQRSNSRAKGRIKRVVRGGSQRNQRHNALSNKRPTPEFADGKRFVTQRGETRRIL